MAEDQQERTEEATQQRRDDFRKRGQVAQTRELASVLVLLGSAFVLGPRSLCTPTGFRTYHVYFGPNLVEAVRTEQVAPLVFLQ
jgi:flagellar biosynthesis protein FlhB